MSSTDHKRILGELLPGDEKANEEESKREVRQITLQDAFEICFMCGHEEMGTRLARAADNGYWDDDVGNADSHGHEGHPSIYDSQARYCDVLAELVVFLNEKGHSVCAAKYARLANRPDLIKHDSTTREEKEESAQVGEKSGGASRNEEATGDVFVDLVDDEMTGLLFDRRDDGRETDQAQPLSPRRAPLEWPAGGFDDNDAATDYMIDLMHWLYTLWRRPFTSADVRIVPTTRGNPDVRPWQQALTLVHNTDQADYSGPTNTGYNFLFPEPGHERLMGKVDCSREGLALIIQVMRAVVCDYKKATPIPPLGTHIDRIDRLKAADDWVEWRLPSESGQTHYVFVEPFEPEGVRAALAALQTAARNSTSGYVLFYVYPIDVEVRERRLAATLDLHPIIRWQI